MPKYCQNKEERLQKRAHERCQSLSKEEMENKNQNVVLCNTKI